MEKLFVKTKWLDKLTLNLTPTPDSSNSNSNSNLNIFPSINNHIETHSSENLEHTFVIIAFKGYNYQNIDKYKLLLIIQKIKRELRNEKFIILSILNFIFFRSESDLENILCM